MEKIQSSQDKQLANDINKLCLNLHSHLVNLPDEITSSVNRVYVSSLLHPIFNLFIKYDFDESIINSFNNEYLKSYPSFKMHNNLLWDIYRTFRRFSNTQRDGTSELICKFCKISVSTTELSLFNHINICKLSPKHDIFMEQVVSNFDWQRRNCTIGYYCDFCELHFISSIGQGFSVHYVKSLHSVGCKGLQGNKREITWVHCDICSIDLYGHNILELHKESIGHKILELNSNPRNLTNENDLDFKTAEYNFMLKHISDITEALPSSFGLQDVRNEAVLSNPVRDKVHVNETSENKNELQFDYISKYNGSTYKNFMLEVVKRTIQNKMSNIYNGYFCDFCQNWTFSEDEFYSHINSSDHNSKMSQQCVQINSCSTCILLIIGNDKTFGAHINCEEHLTLKYLSEIDDRKKIDLNASVMNIKSDDDSNDKECYFSDSSAFDNNNCQQNKSVNFNLSKPRTSGSNNRKFISSSKESINSASSNFNKKSGTKIMKSGKMNISDGSYISKVTRRTSIKVSEFPLATTRNDIFNAFKDYGHIDELKFEKNSSVAIVFYKLKSVADLLTDNNVPIYINGTKVKTEKNVSLKSVMTSNNENKSLPSILQENYKSLLNFKTMISDILIEAISEESNSEKNGKIMLKNEFEKIFKKPVKIIGSFSSGLALSTSIFDVYIDIDDNYLGKKDYIALSFAELAGELKYILKNSYQDKFTDIDFTIRGNPVLILKNKDEHLCNMFFSSGLADQKTELIKTYLKVDSRVKPTVLLVKKWMTLTNMMDSNNLTGYAVTWMVFFYLMSIRNPILPPVIDLRSKVDGVVSIGGWDCCFMKDVSKLRRSENRQSFEELAYGFFKFFSNEKHLKFVCCPLIGEFIRKKDISDLDLPEPFKTYKFNLQTKAIEDKFPTSGGLCLQDPIELNCNLTLKLKDSLFYNFKWMCQETMKLCKPWVLKLNSDC